MLSYAVSLWLFTALPPHAGPNWVPPVVPPSRPAGKSKQTPTVRLGPMLFHVEGGKIKTIEQLDLRELYRAAAQMYQKQQYTTSIRVYHRIIRFFPKHRHLYAALYNLALAYEDNKQYAEAVQYYQQMLRIPSAQAESVLNAKFRIAACYNQLKLWANAFHMYDQLLQTNLNIEDRIDALAYAGRALFHLEKYSLALPLLRLAVLSHLNRPNPNINYAAAMAQYFWGFIHDMRFRKRRFHLPQERLREDLDYKSKHLLEAQRLYLRTIRLRHADWALASLYRVGEMYEHMYNDMMHAPVPKDLKKEEIEIYHELLRQRIKILLAKALLAYRMNLRLADKVGLKSHRWKTRSELRFQQLLGFYRKRFGKMPELLDSKNPTSRPVQPGPTSLPALPRPAVRTVVPAPRTVVPAPRAVAPTSRPIVVQRVAPPTSRPASRPSGRLQPVSPRAVHPPQSPKR